MSRLILRPEPLSPALPNLFLPRRLLGAARRCRLGHWRVGRVTEARGPAPATWMQLFCKLHALVSIALVGLGIMVGASILYEYQCLDDCNKWNMYHTLNEDAPEEDPYTIPDRSVRKPNDPAPSDPPALEAHRPKF